MNFIPYTQVYHILLIICYILDVICYYINIFHEVVQLQHSSSAEYDHPRKDLYIMVIVIAIGWEINKILNAESVSVMANRRESGAVVADCTSQP